MAKSNTYDASSISVLEGLEAVRKRPGMYIGSVSRKGLNHLIYEIVDNAVDEHLAGYCTEIEVTLEKDGSATVQDNGRGIPVGMHAKGMSAERLVFTTLHAGGKFDDSAYKTSGGLHGVGSSVVNALSTWLDVQVMREGKIHHDRYMRGTPTIELENGLLPVIGRTRATGTRIQFLPDPEIFEKTRFSATELKSRLHETAYLNPLLTIHFTDLRGETPEKITVIDNDGTIREIHRGYGAVTPKAAQYGRLPAGHGEGWLEAMGNLYRSFAQCARAKADGTFTPDLIDYPTISDGADGLAFVEACLESNRQGNVWVSIQR